MITAAVSPTHPNARQTPAVFLSAETAVRDTPGGVQLYTRELLQCLTLAGFDLTLIPMSPDMRFSTRLKRKLRPRPYSNLLPPDLPERVCSAAAQTAAPVIFLNGVHLAPLAASLS